MRVGIDARLLFYRRGIGNFVYNLVSALADASDSSEYVLYVDRPASPGLEISDPRFVVKVLRPAIYPIWEQLSLPLAASHDNLDVLHCTANSGPLFLSGRVKLVLTIHDVMYLLPRSRLPASPSAYQRIGRTYLRLIVPMVAQRSSGISTVSNHSLQDIARLLHVPHSKLRVVREAAGRAFNNSSDSSLFTIVATKYGLDTPFLLALGAVDPRKNTARVIEAYARFRELLRIPYKLVVAGLSGAGRDRFMQLSERLRIANEVVLLGFVPEDDLVALYNAATLFAYPSLYEGFGLPVLEAMACGTPVVTSTAGALGEVAGNAAFVVDPLNVEELAQAFFRVVTDRGLRRELIERGVAQTRRFSWRTTALEMTNLYHAVCEQT